MPSRKGSPNKRSIVASRIIREAYPDYDPLKQLVKLANDDSLDPALRAQCAKEVAQYLYPKRKAVEVTGEDGKPVQHNVKIGFK